MCEAPKNIWADGEMVGKLGFASCFDEPMGGGYTRYIRADLVGELVGALEGVLPFTLVGDSDVAWAAIDRAIKALEKMKEKECSTQ
jgi:hypothetical protein